MDMLEEIRAAEALAQKKREDAAAQAKKEADERISKAKLDAEQKLCQAEKQADEINEKAIGVAKTEREAILTKSKISDSIIEVNAKDNLEKASEFIFSKIIA